jgi:hypothetical protein
MINQSLTFHFPDVVGLAQLQQNPDTLLYGCPAGHAVDLKQDVLRSIYTKHEFCDLTGVNVMITIFGEKIGAFLENNWYG